MRVTRYSAQLLHEHNQTSYFLNGNGYRPCAEGRGTRRFQPNFAFSIATKIRVTASSSLSNLGSCSAKASRPARNISGVISASENSSRIPSWVWSRSQCLNTLSAPIWYVNLLIPTKVNEDRSCYRQEPCRLTPLRR